MHIAVVSSGTLRPSCNHGDLLAGQNCEALILAVSCVRSMVFQWLGSLRRAFGTPFLLLVFLIYWTQVRSSFTQDLQPSCNWQAARLIKFDMLQLQTPFARLETKYFSQSAISNTNSPYPHDWVRGSLRAFDHSLGQACLSSSRTS